MKSSKINLAALFLFASSTVLVAQTKTKKEKAEKELETVSIRGSIRKSAESSIISLQKKSVDVVERVGADQLSKQSVGDVAVAVTKAVGTQKKEESGEIFIRGLGDRTNFTLMNGLPIPSDDPVKKNLDLSLLNTNIVEYIALDKVYDVKNWGNVAGATVDIGSKIHTGKPYFRIALGSSVNITAIQNKNFKLGQGTGYFGIDPLNRPSNQKILNQGYFFNTGWANQSVMTPINSSLDIDFGRRFNIGRVGKLGIFGYAGFGNSYNGYKSLLRRVDAIGSDLYNFAGDKFTYATNSTALLNLDYKINSNHEVKATSNFIHTTSQELEEYKGYIRDINENRDEADALYRRTLNKVNNLWINQLSGMHKLSDKLELNWTGGLNLLDSQRPDRQQNTSIANYQSKSVYFPGSNPGANHRYFDKLDQRDISADIHAIYTISENIKLKLGYQNRFRIDDFNAIQYNFRPKTGNLVYHVDPSNYDSYFNTSNYNAGYFSIWTFRGSATDQSALAPQFYKSEITNHGIYFKTDYKISNRLYTQLGVRYDRLDQNLRYNTAILQGKTNKIYDKILPALNMKYELSDRMNLRMSASKTYTTPLVIETAPFEYEDVDLSIIGNKDVDPADNYNVDLKWETFGKPGEVFSITAFGKYIQNPISRITIASAANSLSFANVGDTGRIYGVEVEARKDILKFQNTRLYTFLNASYIDTQQQLDEAKIRKENELIAVNFNKKSDELQGASRYLANANLGLEHKMDNNQSVDIVVSYNHFSDNIFALGHQGMGNLIDKGFGTLDASLRMNLSNGIAVKFSGRNLLNPNVQRIQDNQNEAILVRDKKLGVQVGASVSYTF